MHSNAQLSSLSKNLEESSLVEDEIVEIPLILSGESESSNVTPITGRTMSLEEVMNMNTEAVMQEHDLESVVALGRQAMQIEADEVKKISETLNGPFYGAVMSILNSKGKVGIIGMGKSGIVGKKIMASLASTGTTAFFMHPGEAYHGDLGMADEKDVILMLSNSGETDEVLQVVPHFKEQGNVIISITGNENSTLAKYSDHHILCKVDQEACPLQLAPTASTTAAMAVGDALVVTLMTLRNFKPENFARFHPGGSLGRMLLTKVKDEMRFMDLPWVSKDTSVTDLVHVISDSRIGCALVRNDDVEGIFEMSAFGIVTDGDLRRAMEKYGKDGFFDLKAEDIATQNPVCISESASLQEASSLLDEKKITSLLVLNAQNCVCGIYTNKK